MTQSITAFTLVDITNSGITRIRDNNKREYHQQQNLNVLLQTIGLRTQPFEPKVTPYIESDLQDVGFSDFFGKEPQMVWMLTFYIEGESVWIDDDDPLALLKTDVHGVAITSDLDNTAEFPINMFDTRDNVNTVFRIN